MHFCDAHGPDSLCLCDEFELQRKKYAPKLKTQSWREDMALLGISPLEVKTRCGLTLTENETEAYVEFKRAERIEADEKRQLKFVTGPTTVNQMEESTMDNKQLTANGSMMSARTVMDAHAERNLVDKPASIAITEGDSAEVARLRAIATRYLEQTEEHQKTIQKLKQEASDLRIKNQTLEERADSIVRRDRPRKLKLTLIPSKKLLAKGKPEVAWELLAPQGPPKYLMTVQVPEDMKPADAIEIMRKQKLIFDDTLGKNRVAMAVVFPGHEIMLHELNYDGFEDLKKK